MKRSCQLGRAFTLIELLVVISIIALLVSIMMPSLQGAKEQARAVQCLSTLRNLGAAMSTYHGDNGGQFWPYSENGGFFWGSVRPTDKLVDTKTSSFMPYLSNNLQALACPNQPWGSYVPQAGAKEPTTNFGYNAYALIATKEISPGVYAAVPRQVSDIPEPSKLFVFNDSAMYWAPAGVAILQNSTYLEPVTGSWVQMPTSHFRHRDRTDALCADGHADRYDLEGGAMINPAKKLGFVGTQNYPHYAQP